MEDNKLTISVGSEATPQGIPEIPPTVPSEFESTAQPSNEDTSLPCSDSAPPNVAAMLTAQGDALAKLNELVASRVSSDQAKEKAIHALSDELNFYRDEFVAQSQKGIFIDLIVLYDNVKQAVNLLDNPHELSADDIARVVNNVKNLEGELLEILYRRDVIPFDEHPPALDRRLHRTVKVVPTFIESENDQVTNIFKIGFRWRDKVLRPEEVEIKKFSSDPIQAGENRG